MKILEKIISQSFKNFNLIDEVENFVLYKSNFEIKALGLNQDVFLSHLKEICNLYNEFKGKFNYATLFVRIGESDDISISLLESTLKNSTISSIKDSFLTFDELEDKIYFSFKIDKKISTTNYILSLDSFKKYLTSLSVEDSLEKWDFITESTQKTFFCFWENVNAFTSESLVFHNVNEPFYSSDSLFERDKIIEKRDKVSYFKNSKNSNLVPNDFNFSQINFEGYKDYFDSLKIVLLTIFISDSSVVESESLTYRLKGYKLISEKKIVSTINMSRIDEIYNIYSWAYGDGSFIDKIGLARNIITIHSKENSIFNIEDGTMNSLSSGYDIYLKDNIKQYIDIKNKLSEFIMSQSDKAIEITKSMYNNFKVIIWTFITFFIANFISKIFSLVGTDIKFSNQALIVSFVFTLISICYLILSWREVTSDTKNLVDRFDLIEERYKDLLNEMDLKKALNKDKIIEQQKKAIKTKRNMYAAFWMIFNAIFLGASCLLWYYY